MVEKILGFLNRFRHTAGAMFQCVSRPAQAAAAESGAHPMHGCRRMPGLAVKLGAGRRTGFGKFG